MQTGHIFFLMPSPHQLKKLSTCSPSVGKQTIYNLYIAWSEMMNRESTVSLRHRHLGLDSVKNISATQLYKNDGFDRFLGKHLTITSHPCGKESLGHSALTYNVL